MALSSRNSTTYSPGPTSCKYFLTRSIFIRQKESSDRSLQMDKHCSQASPAGFSCFQCPCSLNCPAKSRAPLHPSKMTGWQFSVSHYRCAHGFQRGECGWWKFMGSGTAFSISKAYALKITNYMGRELPKQWKEIGSPSVPELQTQEAWEVFRKARNLLHWPTEKILLGFFVLWP